MTTRTTSRLEEALALAEDRTGLKHVSFEEARERLRLSRSQLTRQLNAKAIIASKIGRCWVISEDALIAYQDKIVEGAIEAANELKGL